MNDTPGNALDVIENALQHGRDISAEMGRRTAIYDKAFAELSTLRQVQPTSWECFRDAAYYDLWAVRPVGDKDFYSQQLFHVQSEEEAEALKDTLNGALSSPAAHPTAISGLREAVEKTDWYIVEQEKAPCGCCDRGASWVVVGPDGVAEGVCYECAENAEDHCEDLNRAFIKGRAHLAMQESAPESLTLTKGQDTMQSALDSLNDAINIQSSPGNFDVNEYMRGYANGLILARSYIDGVSPVFHEPNPSAPEPVNALPEGHLTVFAPTPFRNDRGEELPDCAAALKTEGEI